MEDHMKPHKPLSTTQRLVKKALGESVLANLEKNAESDANVFLDQSAVVEKTLENRLARLQKEAFGSIPEGLSEAQQVEALKKICVDRVILL